MANNTNTYGIKAGIAWSAIERFATQFIQFLVSIVLARLLTPTDFGVVAIVLVFMTIFQTINESGFNTALIHKLNRTDVDFTTALITNVIIGFVGYLILYLIAPVIADFYNIEGLTEIMRVLGLSLIINSMGIVQNAQFTIRVDFKTQAKASVSAVIISGIIGVWIAYSYKSIYAIVFQNLIYAALNVTMLWILGNWHPKLIFSMESFRDLFSYGYKLILARLIGVVFDDIYSLAIGKLYAPSILAYYNRANSFRQILSKNIVNIIQRVSTPVLCKAQNSSEEMRTILLKFITLSSFVVFPLLAILMILGEDIVYVILGEKWLKTATMFYFVCPIGVCYLISTFNRNIFNATGRTDWALKSEIIKKILFVIVFIVTMKYNIKILLLGLVFDSVFEMLYDIYYAKKQIGIKYVDELKAIVPILIDVVFMSAIMLASSMIFVNHYLSLILGLLAGLSVYILIGYILNIADFKIHIRNIIS